MRRFHIIRNIKSTGGSKCRLKRSSGSYHQHKNRTMPLRPVNADLRKREYLTPHEIERLIKAARKSGKTEAQGQRNATLVLVAYRHGLRAQELCDLEWSQVDWKAATLHVRRVKSGKPAAHPIPGR